MVFIKTRHIHWFSIIEIALENNGKWNFTNFERLYKFYKLLRYHGVIKPPPLYRTTQAKIGLRFSKNKSLRPRLVWDFQKIRACGQDWLAKILGVQIDQKAPQAAQNLAILRQNWPKSAAGGPKFGNIASKLIKKRRRRPKIWQYGVRDFQKIKPCLKIGLRFSKNKTLLEDSFEIFKK